MISYGNVTLVSTNERPYLTERLDFRTLIVLRLLNGAFQRLSIIDSYLCMAFLVYITQFVNNPLLRSVIR